MPPSLNDMPTRLSGVVSLLCIPLGGTTEQVILFPDCFVCAQALAIRGSDPGFHADNGHEIRVDRPAVFVLMDESLRGNERGVGAVEGGPVDGRFVLATFILLLELGCTFSQELPAECCSI